MTEVSIRKREKEKRKSEDGVFCMIVVCEEKIINGSMLSCFYEKIV